MEFDDIKKIWDQQKSETLYAIDEKTLYERIRKRKRRIERVHKINTIGLIAISFICSAILLSIKIDDIFNIGASIMLMLIAGFVLMRDIKRRKDLKNYDNSLLGELNHSIKNLKYQLIFAKTFWLWYIVPLTIPKIIEILSGKINYLSIGVMAGGYLLGIIVVNWEANVKFKPQLKKLESLKMKFEKDPYEVIIQDVEQ